MEIRTLRYFLAVAREENMVFTSAPVSFSIVPIVCLKTCDVAPSLRRNGWDKHNNYMNRQLDLTLSADWATAFQKEAVSVGKVDASFMLRKSFGVLHSVV